jgi:hypothetical protein
MANKLVTVLESDGVTETEITVLDVGRQAAAASKSYALATEDKASLDLITSAAAGSLGKTIDVAAGAADVGVAALVVRDDALATVTPADGDYTHTRANARGAVWVAIDSTVSQFVTPEGTEYETVAASQTAQALGATGATGDYIAGVLIIPATTAPGNVLLLDNATSITIFTGGTASVSNLIPFYVPLGIKSVSGAWKITTGSNVSAIGMGNFT